MTPDDEITRWIGQLAGGDQRAAEALWSAYFERLTRLARRKLDDPALRRQADEEDVALSAMYSFCRGMQAGQYQNLQGRDELWRLLITIVVHKASREQQRQRAASGGGQIRGESAFLSDESDSVSDGIAQALGREPTPELVAMLAENCDQLLARLHDDSLRQVALLKLEGLTNDEIAIRLGCTTRSVERKLGRIRDKWAVAD